MYVMFSAGQYLSTEKGYETYLKLLNSQFFLTDLKKIYQF